MAKNKDSRSVNRTGLFDMESMTVQAEDKSGPHSYNIKKMLEEFDGEIISITVAADFSPSHQVEE